MPPTKDLRPPPLRADPEKYPNLAINPSLERALRIRQELEKGKPRDEAVALADLAMGPLGGKPKSRPKRARGPAKAEKQAARAAKRSR